jgi:hypothetical protein
MSDIEKSDVEKPVEAEAETAAATSATAASAATNGEKSSTFLDKLSRFTIGSNRGELPTDKGTRLIFFFEDFT